MPQGKTREEQQAARWTELEYFAQIEQQRQEKRAADRAQQDEFAQRVQARRDAIDTYIRRSWAQREDRPMTAQEFAQERAEIEQEALAQVKVTIPTWEEIGRQWHDERIAAEAQAEAERRAAISPHDTWLTTLPWAERQHIQKWEQINGMEYPQ